ncbi:hypothetical protein EVAR_78457_1 [Eumeta japonica]|uniref:Uncharacterized protein n=1 Tax=Eumeta variegata TaxID=151549 RepID=A0A4C1TY63_EUMVA|nr:hypothetical protein EVAR_78457_1 [Eumeta japonica]
MVHSTVVSCARESSRRQFVKLIKIHNGGGFSEPICDTIDGADEILNATANSQLALSHPARTALSAAPAPITR